MTNPRNGTQDAGKGGANIARSLLRVFLVAAFLAFVVISLLAYPRLPQGLIASDGKGYYAWLRTIALDRDLDFRNDFALIYPPDPIPTGPTTPSGRLASKYPVGLAIVEAPGFLAGHLVALAGDGPADGVSAPYQFGVTWWLQIVLLFALWRYWGAVVRLGADPAMAALAVAGMLTATNLIHYAVRPAMAHAAGLAMLCFALDLLVDDRNAKGAARFAAVGALLGLAVIIRPTNAALAPFFVPLFLTRGRRPDPSHWAAFLAAVACIVAIQVALTSALWGRLQFQGYEGEGFTAGLRGIAATLFSARHGLFIYHPWYLAALALAALAARQPVTRALGAGAMLSFAVLTLANGTWWSWWFGDGFGNRAFIEVIPALVVPAVLWLSGLVNRRRALACVAAGLALFSVLNAVLWTGYVLRRFPPDGRHSVSQAYLWFVQ